MRLASIRIRHVWLLLVAVALITLAAFGAWVAQAAAVDAIAARHAPLVRTLQFSARIETLSRVQVGATVTGRVAQVLVREGDIVRAGQVLVQLESDELRAARSQAEAAERQAAARLAGLRTTGRRAAQAQLGQAQATLKAASAELARVEQLVAQGFVSGSRLDDARKAVAVAAAQEEAARAQSLATEEQGTDVAQAAAQLQSAHAATLAARAKLDQAAIVAPRDGRVLLRDVEPGLIVQPGRALLSLALSGPTQVVAQVDERFLDQLRVGQKAAIVADAFSTHRLAGSVLSIAPEVDAQRGAVEVKFSLEQPPPAFLHEDMTLSVEVETGRSDRALVLPARGVRAVDGGNVVLVARDGRAVERRVQLGLRTVEAVQVLDGVAEGELVLLGPAVRAGDRVRAREVPWQPARSPLARGGGSQGDPFSGITQTMGR